MNAIATALDTVEKAVEWLGKLNLEVNREVRGTMRANMSGTEHDYTELVRVRDLTQPEWEQVVALVQRYELPCELGSTGFTWALCIYGHSPLPEFRPDMILAVEARQVPVPGTQGSLGAKEVALEKLAWLTHGPRNKQLLDWYKLEQPRAPSHYTY